MVGRFAVTVGSTFARCVRGRDRLRFYRIDPRGAAAGSHALTDVTVVDAPRLFNDTENAVEEQQTGYGLAVRPTRDGQSYVVVSRRHTTELGLFRIASEPGCALGYFRTDGVALADTFTLADGSTWSPCEEPGEGPQVEGMVVDRRLDVLYAAQEDVGVWRIPLSGPEFGTPELVAKVREFGVPATFDAEAEECVLDAPVKAYRHLSADAEGLTIAYYPNGRALLMASSQGDSTFALYRLRQRPWFITSFAIGARAGVPDLDAVDHSDGAAVYRGWVGSRYPGGLLVLHDGENTPESVDAEGETRTDTNFKFLRWDAVVKAVLG